MNKYAGFGAVFLLVFLAIGCGGNREATVVGRVTIDGEPLTHGTVAFLAGSKTDTPAATGAIQSDGSYRVQIGQSGKLVSGEYAARVTASEPSIPDPEGGPPTPGALITPVCYADINTSGLRYNIRSGENVIDIALVSGGALVSDGPEADGPAAPLGEDDSKSEAAHQDATESIEEESEKKEKEGPQEPAADAPEQPAAEESTGPSADHSDETGSSQMKSDHRSVGGGLKMIDTFRNSS